MSPFDEKDAFCEWVLEKLEAHYDGDLSSKEVFKLEAHLQVCSSCSAEWALVRQVNEALHSLPEEQCPDAVVNAALARADGSISLEEKSPGGWPGLLSWRVFRPAAVGATLILALAMAVFIGQRQQPVSGYLFGDDSIEMDPAAIAMAKAEVKWTFAYIGKVGRRAGIAFRNDAIYPHVVLPVQHAVETAFDRKTPHRPKSNGQN